MKAWVSGPSPGLEHLDVKEIALPKRDADHLLVRVTHAALNYSDLLMVADTYQVRPPRPFVVGQELAGIVEDAPEGSAFKPGDAVASKVLWGGFAEYALVRQDMAIRVPEGFSLSQAAALPVSYTTALVALDTCARLTPADTVLIHAAAGGVGLAAVEIAAANGGTVIATAGSQEKLETAKAHGAHHLVCYRDSDWVDQVKSITGGRGANVILDPVGGEIGENSLRCIAHDGRYLIVGFSSGAMQKLAPHRLLLKRASAIGVYWNHDTDAALLAGLQTKLEGLIAEGHINPLVDERHSIGNLPEALDDLANRRIQGKAVLNADASKGAWA